MLNNSDHQRSETFISIIVCIHNFLFRRVADVIYSLNHFFESHNVSRLIVLNNIDENIFFSHKQTTIVNVDAFK